MQGKRTLDRLRDDSHCEDEHLETLRTQPNHQCLHWPSMQWLRFPPIQAPTAEPSPADQGQLPVRRESREREVDVIRGVRLSDGALDLDLDALDLGLDAGDEGDGGSDDVENEPAAIAH